MVYSLVYTIKEYIQSIGYISCIRLTKSYNACRDSLIKLTKAGNFMSFKVLPYPNMSNT
jgi:hypothetical protein